MEFNSFSNVQSPMTAYDRIKRHRSNHPEYRDREAEGKYLSRPFIFWDGEGVTREDGSHDYIMLANSEGDYIQDLNGLASWDIIDMLLTAKGACPKNAIHVIYGGGYDFNMWLKDFDEAFIRKLYADGSAWFGRVKFTWRRGKYLRIKRDGVSITVSDVVSFFQCSFVKACDDYLGADWFMRDNIVANKLLRSNFSADDVADIKRYNAAELVNGVRLMDELRLRLNRVGLRPGRWDGPGAIAATLLTRESVRDAIPNEFPDAVRYAARCAYFGGRFELLKHGDNHAPVYEYDVNSAYPHALRFVPNLNRGEWVNRTEYVEPPTSIEQFAMYRVSFYGDADMCDLPQPLPLRDYRGMIAYPVTVKGSWYWASEVVSLMAYCGKYGGTYVLHESHEFVEYDSNDRPFEFIERLYLKRQALKKAGDGAHVGLKLGLNSMYGKVCQRIGGRVNPDGTWSIPPYHCLPWGGFITAYCRHMVYNASMNDLRQVIAFETDAVFTQSELPLEDSNKLGGWERTVFNDLMYLQSGFYFATDTNGKQVDKTRGVDRGTLKREQVRAALARGDDYVEAPLTRFIGAGLAIQLNNFDHWNRWETVTKKMKLWPQGKRTSFEHYDDAIMTPGWHNTFPEAFYNEGEDQPSFPHYIPWEPDSMVEEFPRNETAQEMHELREAGIYDA